MNNDNSANEKENVLGWAEFACWTALVFVPFLQWVNGPAVSTDQAVVRTALVVIAVSGAVALRIVNWSRKSRGRGHRKREGRRVEGETRV